MSLAWSTIAVLVLLLPGFLFFLGFYYPEHASREAAPIGPLTQLAFLVLVSFLIHGVAYGVAPHVCGATVPCIRLDYLLTLVNVSIPEPGALREIADNIRQHRWSILAYIAGTGFIGFLIGAAAGRAVVAGRLRSFAQHGWIYDLMSVREDEFITAHILTHIRHDDRVLVYRGFLEEFYFTKEGKISYLVLAQCTRYYLHLAAPIARVSPREDWRPIGATQGSFDGDAPVRASSLLVIEGEDIANVVFDHYTAPPIPSMKEVEKQIEA